MKIIVDTSVFIDYLRGRSYLEDIVIKLRDASQLYLPSVVLFELFSGESTRKQAVQTKIDIVIDRFHMIELTADIAKRAGELYRDGVRGFGAADYIIAATALEIGAVVLTLNRKHFERIPGLVLYPSLSN